MLTLVGIRTKLHTGMGDLVGERPGRQGSVLLYGTRRGRGPERSAPQYFETGASPRIGYSNPKLTSCWRWSGRLSILRSAKNYSARP